MDLDIKSEPLQDGPTERSERTLLSNLPRSALTQTDNDSKHENANGPVKVTRRTNPNQVGAVISKIEDIFESITDCILEERRELVIELKSRSKSNLKAQKSETEKVEVELEEDEDEEMELRRRTTKITFPSRNQKEAWKFTALLRILELSHEALVTGIVTTKRDIYYREPELFTKQAVVDRYVDDIAHTFGVGRDALNIVAAAKGLVAGSFRLTRTDTSIIDATVEPEGVLIPNPHEIESIQFLDVRWILVIEKEAKGYPDIQTRQFLHLLSTHHPSIPIYALVDFDPDGLGTMSTYKHGSQALSHELNLKVPSVQWLGVRSCDFLGKENDTRGLLKLTARDRRIALKMLERDELREEEWRGELQVMLFLNVKAEIQILGNGERLGEWLDGKLMGM
ncbi:hypothetical protein VTL71DRAFT_1969 [Oculimacula yallundae]|uniref:DNA topoisomerase (ATP-hydrolyzing) n=1 Tax=Oculimacula yallundae TaxID=86028 RepID=A0ABR4CCA2_9HELO